MSAEKEVRVGATYMAVRSLPSEGHQTPEHPFSECPFQRPMVVQMMLPLELGTAHRPIPRWVDPALVVQKVEDSSSF